MNILLFCIIFSPRREYYAPEERPMHSLSEPEDEYVTDLPSMAMDHSRKDSSNNMDDDDENHNHNSSSSGDGYSVSPPPEKQRRMGVDGVDENGIMVEKLVFCLRCLKSWLRVSQL